MLHSTLYQIGKRLKVKNSATASHLAPYQWQQPLVNFIECNGDAVIFLNQKLIGFGVLFVILMVLF